MQAQHHAVRVKLRYAMISPPTEGDYGYYFLDRGMLKTDELLHRNPGAAIKITISSHARGPVG